MSFKTLEYKQCEAVIKRIKEYDALEIKFKEDDWDAMKSLIDDLKDIFTENNPEFMNIQEEINVT